MTLPRAQRTDLDTDKNSPSSLAIRVQECGDDPGYVVAAFLDEISGALSADHAFICIEGGKASMPLCQAIPTVEFDENGSLLSFPFSGRQIAFVRGAKQAPFTIQDGLRVSRSILTMAPAFDLMAKRPGKIDLARSTVAALAAALDAKDGCTLGHSRRVADLSVAIGKNIGFPAEEIRELKVAALMHDLGKKR